ncbi:MAG: four helix bundle protein [Planctomycetota bacterium]|nr:four helix bundle protein [Planctomycetota bacterium]
MATIRRFEDLEAWKAARKLAQMVYQVTKDRAFSPDPDLRRQMRKAAVSAVSNTAEGFERGGRAEFINFLSIAKGSVAEIQAQLYVALDQAYVTQQQFHEVQAQGDSTKRLIAGLMQYLQASDLKGEKFRRPTSRAANQKPETTNHKPEGRYATRQS